MASQTASVFCLLLLQTGVASARISLFRPKTSVPTTGTAATTLTETIHEELGIMSTTKRFVQNCCGSSGLATDVTEDEARDLLGGAPENSVFLNWLLEPLGDFTRQERADAASFILGFPLMMKTNNDDGFIVGQRNRGDTSLSSCAVLYPHSNNKKKSFLSSVSPFWTGIKSYHLMIKDGIRVPSFLRDGAKRGRFLKMVQQMDSEADRLQEQYMGKDQDHLVLFQVGNSQNNRHMLQEIVKGADTSQWPIYASCSDEELCRTLRDELGFAHRGTKHIVDPVDETRGFDLHIMTRQPRS